MDMDMDNTFSKPAIPYYASFTIKLFMITLIGIILIYGKPFFIPLAFSILLAILLLPVTNFFEKKFKFSKATSALSSIIISMALIIGLIYFLSQQVSAFVSDIPSIKQHLQMHYKTLTDWVNQKFHITKSAQKELIQNATDDVKSSGTEWISKTLMAVTSSAFFTIMIAIFSFLILLYRTTIRKFLYSVFKEPLEPDVTYVLGESKVIIQKYMVGLFIEMGIIALANTLLLLILGVKYALFLGILAAILNIIPYVGILSGIIITCLVTLTTSNSLGTIAWIIIGMEIIHFFDSNILMPKIVGSRVKINALVTIIGVVIGGNLLGLPGIFLALPVIAILKVIFDRVDGLKPWGLLMGDDTEHRRNKIIEKLERRFTHKPPVTTIANPGHDVI